MRVLVAAFGCVAAVCLMAGPAAAKAGLEVSAVPVTVGAVPTDEVSVAASGGDDAAGYQRLCLQQARGAGWRTFACGPVGFGDAAAVQAFVRRAPSGGETFRAVLERAVRDGRGGAVYVTDLASQPVRLPAAAASGLGGAPTALGELVGLVLHR